LNWGAFLVIKKMLAILVVCKLRDCHNFNPAVPCPEWLNYQLQTNLT
jgi:hypothetical protein